MTTFRNAFALIAFALTLSACAFLDDRPTTSARAGANISWTPTTEWDRLADLPWPQGGQRTYQNYDEARRIFWKKLYPNGGTEVYCGVKFDGARKDPVNEALSVEHAYPADSIAETEPTCTDRTCTVTRVATGLALEPVDSLIEEFLPDVAKRIHVRIIFVQQILNQVVSEQRLNQ